MRERTKIFKYLLPVLIYVILFSHNIFSMDFYENAEWDDPVETLPWDTVEEMDAWNEENLTEGNDIYFDSDHNSQPGISADNEDSSIQPFTEYDGDSQIEGIGLEEIGLEEIELEEIGLEDSGFSSSSGISKGSFHILPVSPIKPNTPIAQVVPIIYEKDGYPYLSDDDAKVFLAFLYKKADVIKADLSNNHIFQLITGKFDQFETYEDVDAAIVDFSLFARTSMKTQADDASAKVNVLSGQLINLLESKVSKLSNLDEQIVKSVVLKTKKQLRNGLIDLFSGTISELTGISVTESVIDNILLAFDTYNKSKTLAKTTENVIDYTIAAMEAAVIGLKSEIKGRAKYFNSYLSNRPDYSSASDPTFEAVMDYNKIAAENDSVMSELINTVSYITKKNSWNNHITTLNRWAEFLFLLENAAFTHEPSDLYSGTCGDNLSWILDDDGVLTINGSGNMTDCVVQDEYGNLINNAPWEAIKEKIQKVVINNSVTSIGISAFFACSNLREVIIPDSVTAIRTSAFADCTSLESISIGSSVSEIGGYVFSNCTSLESIILPDEIKSINYHLFRGCRKLTSIFIGSSIEYIDRHAFEDCSSLRRIYYNGAEYQWSSVEKSSLSVWDDDYVDYFGMAEVICLKAGPKLLPAPSNVTVSKIKPAKGKLTVKFKKVQGAEKYKISYHEQGRNVWYKQETKGTSLGLKGLSRGAVYEINVSAGDILADGSTQWGEPSESVLIWNEVAEQNKTKSGGKGVVVLSWKAIPKASGYRICYSTTSSMNNTTYVFSAGGATNYRLTGLSSRTTYYFRIQPCITVNGTTIYGVASNQRSRKVK